MEQVQQDDSLFADAVSSGDFPLAQFNHRAHLRFAFVLLRRAPFLEACIAMRETLQGFARRAGKPGLYHKTITIALMSLFAERIASSSCQVDSFEPFIAANPDLCERTLLHRYYPPEVLATQRARSQFILGERAREST